MSKFFANLSVRNKLISVIMLTSIISVTSALFLFNLKEIFNYRNIMQSNLSILAQVVGKNCTSALIFNDHNNASENLQLFSSENDIKKAILLDNQGQTFAVYQHPDQTHKKTTPNSEFLLKQVMKIDHQGWLEGMPFFDRYLDLMEPIIFNDEKIGELYIQQSLEKFYSQLLTRFWTLLLILLSATCIAYFLAQKGQKLFTTPITNLVKNIHDISNHNNYQVRMKNPYQQEFGVLISGFNNMLKQIQKRDDELAAHRDHLENEVWKRTEDLQKTMLDLTRAKDAAEASDRAKSEFLTNMSHELRTPLNHIIGFTDLVLTEKCGSVNELQSEYLNDVSNSSQHLLSLINDILDLSKVEAGKMKLETKPIELQPFLEMSLKMIRERALKHGLAISLEVAPEISIVQADKRKLKQIVYNLLANAAKFTPDGGSIGVRAEIMSHEVSLTDLEQKPQTWLKISIKDSGIGIKQEDLERIFKSFEQADGSHSRHYQGTGLGLSLTRRLVELHQGRIWADSKGPGLGSTFSFIIPYTVGTNPNLESSTKMTLSSWS